MRGRLMSTVLVLVAAGRSAAGDAIEVVPQLGHRADIAAVALSPDGRWAVTGGGALILWDAGRVVREFPVGGSPKWVGVDPDGKRVFAALSLGGFEVWDSATGRKVVSLAEGVIGYPQSFAQSADGRRVAFGYADAAGKLVVRDAGTGEVVGKPVTFPKSVTAVALNRDGTRAAAFTSPRYGDTDPPKAASEEGTVWVGPADGSGAGKTFESPEHLRGKVPFGPRSRLYGSVALDGSGDRVLAATEAGCAVWDAAGGVRLSGRSFDADPKGYFDGGVFPVGLSADGKTALVRPKKKPAAVFDAVTNKDLRAAGFDDTPFSGMTGKWVPTVLSGDGASLLAVSQRAGHTAEVIDLRTGGVKRILAGTPPEFARDAAKGLSLSEDGTRLADCTQFHAVSVWDMARGTKVRTFVLAREIVEAVALSRDGKRLAAALVPRSGEAGPYRCGVLWDVETGSEVQSFPGDREGGEFVSLSPDGGRVLIAGRKAATVWAAGGEKLKTLAGTLARVRSVAFADGGRAVVWVGEQKHRERGYEVAHVQDVDGGKVVRILPQDPATLPNRDGPPNGLDAAMRLQAALEPRKGPVVPFGIVAATLTPDGRGLVGADGERVGVWDVATGTPKFGWNEKAGVAAVALSPDGALCAAACDDGTICVRALATGVVQRVIVASESARADGARAAAVAFSKDGRRLVAFKPGGVRLALYDVATGRELCRMLEAGGDDWLAVAPDGRFDGTRGGRNKVYLRVGEGLNVVPADRLFQDCYRPGLLASLWAGDGKEPAPEVSGAKQPPRVRVVSPRNGTEVADDEIEVVAEVIDADGGIEGPFLFQNGARQYESGAARAVKEGNVVRRTFRADLVPGENVFEVRAANGTGAWESEPAVVRVYRAKKGARPNLYVLAVGVSKYADPKLALKFPAADAAALARMFEDLGKDTLYGTVRTKVLADAEVGDRGVRSALDAWAGQVRASDTLVVYFAGQGATVGHQHYLIPHAFNPSAEATPEESLRKHAIRADQLGEWAAGLPATRRLLVLDTSGGGAGQGLVERGRNPFAFRGAVERMSRTEGLFAVAATASGPAAAERDDLGAGLLTYPLLAAFGRVPGGPLRDRRLTPFGADAVADVAEWLGFATSAVPDLAAGRPLDVYVSGHGATFPLLPVRPK